MRKVAVLNLLFACALASAQARTAQSRKKVPRTVPAKPECAQGSVCFSGEIQKGQGFRKNLNSELDFVLTVPGEIDIVLREPESRCKLSAWVANPPFMAHHDTEIDASYDWTAETEVEASPRVFRFATNCADYERLFDLSQNDAEKYFASLNLLAKGQGRLWITDSKITPSHRGADPDNGAIEWIEFSVEIKLPTPN